MTEFTKCVLCVCLMTSLTVQGSRDNSYYDCQVYSDQKDLPTEKAECVYDYIDRLHYCKSWECEDPACPLEEQVTREGQSCPLCPGTCTSGGKIYNVGEAIPCVDGVNICRCVATGRAFSTYVGTNKFSLCGAPFPTGEFDRVR